MIKQHEPLDFLLQLLREPLSILEVATERKPVRCWRRGGFLISNANGRLCAPCKVVGAAGSGWGMAMLLQPPLVVITVNADKYNLEHCSHIRILLVISSVLPAESKQEVTIYLQFKRGSCGR